MFKHVIVYSVLSVALNRGYCQAGPETFQFDTSKMQVKIDLDKQTYLPGEIAQVTLVVSNPTSSPVTSLTPFLMSTTCFSSLQRNGDSWKPMGSPPCASIPVDATVLTTFAAGEARRVVMNSYDRLFDSGETVLFERSAPMRAGSYIVSVLYGTSETATAEYTVAPAKFEADAIARLRDVQYDRRPGVVPAEILRYYVHVVALRSEETSYICVAQSATTNPDLLARKEMINGTVDFDFSNVHGGGTPLKRVATSAAPITNLTATADADENLIIEWTDSSGQQGRLNYPASYPARSTPRKR